MSGAPETSRNGVKCGACDAQADICAGSVQFYLKSGETTAQVWKCESCGTYIQDADFDAPETRGHFEVASYTDPAEIEHWRGLRSGFFDHVIGLAARHLGRPLAGCRTLDFGIAYGIMLDKLRERGATPDGVETVSFLRESARDRGFVIHDDIYRLPHASYDVFTAVDSFYYIQDPVRAMVSVRRALKVDGVVVMRLANRTLYFNMMRLLGIDIPEKRFGDLKYFYTFRGAQLLLQRTGFDVEHVYWTDKGRKDPRVLESVYYRLSPILNAILPVNISPGMTIIARPASSSIEY